MVSRDIGIITAVRCVLVGWLKDFFVTRRTKAPNLHRGPFRYSKS